MAQKLDGPRRGAAHKPVRQLVVFIHGYGADGADLIALSERWAQLVPHAAFAAPNGPERCAMAPMGYQWFPIVRLDPPEIWAGVQAAAPALNAFIDAELARFGLGPSDLALVGFSQGTMMALHVGLRRPQPPAAILGYSGALAGPDYLAGEIAGRPPVFLIHGDLDEIVVLDRMWEAAQALKESSVPVQHHISKGAGHGIAPDGLVLGGRFLAAQFEAPGLEG